MQNVIVYARHCAPSFMLTLLRAGGRLRATPADDRESREHAGRSGAMLNDNCGNLFQLTELKGTEVGGVDRTPGRRGSRDPVLDGRRPAFTARRPKAYPSASVIDENGPAPLRVLHVPELLAAHPRSSRWTSLRRSSRRLIPGFACVGVGRVFRPPPGRA